MHTKSPLSTDFSSQSEKSCAQSATLSEICFTGSGNKCLFVLFCFFVMSNHRLMRQCETKKFTQLQLKNKNKQDTRQGTVREHKVQNLCDAVTHKNTIFRSFTDQTPNSPSLYLCSKIQTTTGREKRKSSQTCNLKTKQKQTNPSA